MSMLLIFLSASANLELITSRLLMLTSANAIEFSGVADYVDCGDPANDFFDLTGDATMEAWVKTVSIPPPAGGGTADVVLGKDEGPGTQLKWFFGVQDGGLAFHWGFEPSGQGWLYSDLFTQPATTEYYHVAMVKQGTSYTFYMNGQDFGTSTGPASIITETSLKIGFGESCCQFDGVLDEVRFWNVARTSAQISGTMSISLTGSEPGLIGYWPLEEGTGSTTIDLTGNGNDGTLTGGASWTSQGAPLIDLNLDAAVEEMISPSPPYPSGTQNFTVAVANHGLDTLTVLDINWQFDGVGQPSVNYLDTIFPLGDTVHVIIGTQDIIPGQLHQIKVWTSNPNGQPDENLLNDTLTTSASSPLGGIYTIGGTNPDFLNFTAALNQMMDFQVGGPVTFKVRNGTYTEQLNILEIPGVSSANPVVFESESGDSTQVTLTSSTENFTLGFTASNWVTFRKMTIEATHTGHAVIFQDSTNNCILENNIIKNLTTTSISAAQTVVLLPSNQFAQNILLQNNRIQNGSYGIFCDGNHPGFIAQNNDIENAYYSGISQSNNVAPIMLENRITTTSNHEGYNGINMFGCSGSFKANHNQITDQSGGIGIYIQSTGDPNNHGLISNNFIQIGGTSLAEGIHSVFGGFHDIVYNNIHITSTHPEGRALYNRGGAGRNVLNNIFYNSGGGYAVYSLSNTGLACDYNDLFSSGANLGWYNSVTQPDLPAWQTATSLDSNSISKKPQYVSTTDLHITNDTLDKKGTPFSTVLTDIDGTFRDPYTPDIGADEILTAQHDAISLAIHTPLKPFQVGTYPVYMKLLNNGSDTLENISFDWTVNGLSQIPFSWSGSIPPGTVLDSIEIGQYSFALNDAYQFVVWTHDPNGMVDGNMTNDTITSENIYAALSGMYTIGGVNPDYVDFNNATTALVNGGVAGDVVFDVRDGIYNENIYLPAIEGTAANKTVTLQSESGDSTGVLITMDTSTPVVHLDGVDWLRLKRMTIKTTNISNGAFTMLMSNGVQNTHFEGNIFEAVYTPNWWTAQFNVYSNDASCSNLTFNGNRFINGKAGVKLLGQLNQESGIVVEGNFFENQTIAGVNLIDQLSPIVTTNQFTTDVINGGSGYWAVDLNNCSGTYQVLKNQMINVVQGTGVRLLNCSSSPNRGLVANNFIHVGTIGGSLGLKLNGTSSCDILHNNVNNIGPGDVAAIEITGGNDLTFKNNVFVQGNTGQAVRFFSNPTNINADYNDLYAPGGNIGRVDGTFYPDLISWQNATGQDNNSISIDPDFESADNLHVQEVDLNNTAFPTGIILEDIDGDIRSAITPDIGADEFFPVTLNDMEVESIISHGEGVLFPEGNQAILAELKNNGSDTIFSTDVRWFINNANQPPYSWTGVLSPGERDTVAIGNFDFLPGIEYELLAYTYLPNGMADSLSYNDTARVENRYAALNGDYTIGGLFPIFQNFNHAATTLNLGGVLGPVILNARNGTYNEQFTLNAIPGASDTTNIVFQSESGDSSTVTITHVHTGPHGDNHLIILNGSSWVTFRNLKMHTPDQFYSQILRITGGATNNLIEHNWIVSDGNHTTLIIIDNNHSDNNTIRNNRIENGKFGIGQSSGSQYQGPHVQGVLIENNHFINQTKYGINFRYYDHPVVIDNTFSTVIPTTGYAAIEATDMINGGIISGNKISTIGGNGINLIVSNGSVVNPLSITNNAISIYDGTDASFGLRITGSYHEVFYNSISNESMHLASATIYAQSGANNEVLNNIFSHTGNGTAIILENSGIFSSSNYNNFFAGANATLGKYAGVVTPDLFDWQTESGMDVNSLSVDPLFLASTDLHIAQSQLDSMATPIDSILIDFDGDDRNPSHPDIGADEISFLPDNVGVSLVIAPVSACALSNNEPVTVRIQNFSSTPQTGFDVVFQHNNQTPVVENIGGVVIPPGASLDYTFTNSIDLSEYGVDTLLAYTDFIDDIFKENDTTTSVIINEQIPDIPINMVPVDSSYGLPINTTLSWQASDNATEYGVKIWNDTLPEPAEFNVIGLDQINLAATPYLTYADTFSWRVMASNDFCSNLSDEQLFSIEHLSDILPLNMEAPDTAFNGSTISLTWQTYNQGAGATQMTNWGERIFLSEDPNFNYIGDLHLGSVSNSNALLPGDTSANTIMVTPPNNLVGLYYLILVLDQWDNLPESDNSNNIISIPIYFELVPPPDLEVTSILLNPTPVFSGTPLQIIRTVTNNGIGPTASAGWVDRHYYSQSPTFSLNSAFFFKEQQFLGTLQVNESYSDTITWTPPINFSGSYYIYITTDIYGSEFEHAFEDNNTTRSNAFDIIIQPPPDLVVENILPPDPSSNNENIVFSYDRKNQGATDALPPWTDKVYFYPNLNLLNVENAIYVGEHTFNDTIPGGATVPASVDLPIPNGITGNYYIYIQTDANDQVFEYTFENNNLDNSITPITVLTPDLTIDSVSGPTSATSGEVIVVQWTVKNASIDATVVNGSWLDEVGISSASTNTGGPITSLNTLHSTSTLLPEGILIRQVAVQIPNGISGQHYLYVQTDINNDVYEPNESNNVNATGVAINIMLTPWPDLHPSSVQPGPNPTAGTPMDVTYSIENAGTGTAQGAAWNDKVYIQNSPSFNPNSAILLNTSDEIQVLPAGNNYTRMETVIPPNILPGGTYYLFIITDTGNAIFENIDEGNNLLASVAFTLAPYPDVDLETTITSAPDSVQTGQQFSLLYEVENISSTSTAISNWGDAVYLSTDSVYNPGMDILIATYDQTTSIAAGQSVPIQLNNISIPHGTATGDYYLIAVVDYNQLNVESDYSNNAAMLKDTNNMALTVHVFFPPPSDLFISLLNTPTNATTGQPIDVIYKVVNQGIGATQSSNWHDVFFLSTDFILDANDVYIGTANHLGDLLIDSLYTDTVTLNIPNNITSNQILILSTDHYDAEYEHDWEGNNQAGIAINITQNPPADLIVDNMVIPPMAVAGEQASFDWDVKNIGQNPSIGYRRDALYLSENTLWEVTDPLLGFININSIIQPLGSETQSLSLPVSGVSTGDYYVIIRTDILDNINESNDVNNTTVSSEQIMVTVPLLPMDSLMANSLEDDADLYYRIEIHDTLVGETMLVNLEGDSLNGNNELYLSLNEVPSQVNYDYNFSNPFSGNQNILVPTIEEGTYYVYIKGSTSGTPPQAITIKAEIIDFQILSVNADEGGDTGSMTVEVRGAKFTPDMTMYLDNGTTTIYAHSIYYSNSTKVYASFDLSGAANGLYDVSAEKTGSEMTTLMEGFTIVPGSVTGTTGGTGNGFYCNIENIGASNSLASSVQHPGRTRPNRVVRIDIHYGNEGNVDIPTPIRFVVALEGAQLAFEVSDLPDNLQELMLEFIEVGGPPEILRPGVTGTITVYTKAIAPLLFALSGN